MITVDNVKSDVDIQRLPVNSEEHKFQSWLIKYKKSHILHSQCSTTEKCSSDACEEKCQFCMYTNTLELPHLPEMVFPNNVLSLVHESGAQIEFNALDALKKVCNGKLPIKVAYSDAWKETRSPSHLEEKIKPFDWTFSSDYRGTLSGPFTVTQTDERINIEKLKEREKILFYHELMLYEDELHDNGIASCTVKIVRMESGFRELGLPLPMFADPNLISPHLPLRTSIYEKLTFTVDMNGPRAAVSVQPIVESTSE